MAYHPAAETLVACVWLPEFPIQVECWRRPEWRGAPLALLASERSAGVVAASREARALGVREGMPLREVTATAPQVLLQPADEPCYQETFTCLAARLEMVTPLVELAAPGRAFLGLDGLIAGGTGESAVFPPAAYLYESAEALMAALEQSVPSEFVARFGVGRGKFVAWAAARYPAERPEARFSSSRRTCWIADVGRAAFLRPLPASLLPVSARMRSSLRRFGVGALGELAALPLSAVLAQFGAEGRRAWLLSQGRDEEPLRPRDAPSEIEETYEFDAPETTLEGLLIAVRQLLEKTLQRPERRGRGVRQARLAARLETGYTWTQTLTFRRPGTQLGHLFPAVRYALDRTRPPAAVDVLTVALTAFTPCVSGQQALFLEPQRERQERLAEELRQLRVRLGKALVARILEVDPCSRLPERRYRLGSYDP